MNFSTDHGGEIVKLIGIPSIVALSFFIFWSSTIMASARPEYEKQIQDFQAKRNASLEKNWLVITGLDWLRDGENTVGSSPAAAVRMPPTLPAKFAKIYQKGKKPDLKLEIEFLVPEGVTVGGEIAKPGKRYELKADQVVEPTLVQYKNVTFHLIERPNGVGVRTKDKESEAVKKFKGVRWFPADEKSRVIAKYVKLPSPKVMRFKDVLGNENESKINGYAEFEYGNQKVTLYPVEEGKTFEFIFRDLTSGKETYGAARYLSCDPPNAKGEIVLDFNLAINPPCAVTPFATCPLAPPENNLKVAIRAGEMKPEGTGH